MILRWLVCEYVPVWLDLVPSLRSHAAAIRDMPLSDDDAVTVVLGAAHTAAREAAMIRAHAVDGWTTVQDAIPCAAWDTDRWSAGSAAGNVAADETGNTARETAVYAIAYTMYQRGAMRFTLRPTVERLQISACELIRSMCEMCAVRR